ncbi:MAG: hypothetical protein HYY97_15975 [Rhodocyclales bacterium]|nr:hypothetical protein [Rhodocyclales bacterium]
MNTIDAAHRICAEFPGGAEALAHRLHMRPAVLRAKCNPNGPANGSTYQLGIIDAARMQAVAGRFDILHAFADECGFMATPLPYVHGDDLPHALATTCAEFGDYLREVDRAMKDGRVTLNEVKRLEHELTEMMAAAVALQAMLTGKGKR